MAVPGVAEETPTPRGPSQAAAPSQTLGWGTTLAWHHQRRNGSSLRDGRLPQQHREPLPLGQLEELGLLDGLLDGLLLREPWWLEVLERHLLLHSILLHR
jgi:hypothetical protein